MMNSRTTQLEALLLDNEIKSIFTDSLKSIFQSEKPEFELLINFIYYREKISKNKPLPGQELQNIQFCALGQKQKILYLSFQVIGPYLHKKFKNRLQATSKYFKLLEYIYKAAHTIYFLIFLAKGKMVHSFILYLIGIKIKQIKENVTRELDFELVNRVVIWEVINKILEFTLSTSNSLIHQFKEYFFISSFLGNLQQAQENSNSCSVCNESVKTMETKLLPCEHSFCYYCSKSRGDRCPKCNENINEFKLLHQS